MFCSRSNTLCDLVWMLFVYFWRFWPIVVEKWRFSTIVSILRLIFCIK
jgi:hypothetical protein